MDKPQNLSKLLINVNWNDLDKAEQSTMQELNKLLLIENWYDNPFISDQIDHLFSNLKIFKQKIGVEQ